MSQPYKYVVVSLPRSQSFWLAGALGFDHDISAQIMAGKYEPRSQGLCDTGLYALPKEMQDMAIGPETKILRLRRRPNDVIGSFLKHFPNANMVELCKLIDGLKRKLDDFCMERGVRESINFPIESVSFAKTTRFFFGEPAEFSERRDLLDCPVYKQHLQSLLPHVFP